jgi:3,4-dihydroxy 2-butanone 4-phosphate synthase/GTP cyclohydrolase II
VLGEVDQTGGDSAPVLVRVHSECLTGDVFDSRRCDCGEQLGAATAKIGEVGRGMIVYLRGHEGRGIGLSHKLRAYTLQDAGLDTEPRPGPARGQPGVRRRRPDPARPGRARDPSDGNKPAKYRGLAGHGVRIAAREPLVIAPNPDNISYLTTKRTRLDHHLGRELPSSVDGSGAS